MPDNDLLTIPTLARQVGAHPNTVRRLLRLGNIPYQVEDMVSGTVVPPEAPRPKRFRYLIPPAAVQHVVSLLVPSVNSPGKVPVSATGAITTVTSQVSTEEVYRLRRDVARLEGENALLKQHNAYMENLTDRLLPLLPPAPTTQQQDGRPWWRFWGWRKEGK